MSDLALNKNLVSSEPTDAVTSVARTLTLTTLRRLDGARKGEVVRFLHEARLIATRNTPPVNLVNANLAGADLSNADLRGANLRGADLTRAHVTFSNLTGADLEQVTLVHANLKGTVLKE